MWASLGGRWFACDYFGRSVPVDVTVVIPTRDRPEMLQRCLAALEQQNGVELEVVVVDDSPDHTARPVVAQFERRTLGNNLRYLVSNGSGPAAARNIGWQSGRGQIVAFTDDDCVPEPTWLLAGVAEFDHGADLVSGRVVVPLTASPTDYERDTAGLDGALFVTANCFYTRTLLQRLCGFDERFKSAWREDSDLYFRALEIGAVPSTAADAIVLHPVRPACWGVSLRQQRKSLYNALLYRKHPSRYRLSVQKWPPVHYYLVVMATGGCLVSWAKGSRKLTCLCVEVWLCLVARFCFSRLQGTSKRPSHVIEMAVTSALIPYAAIYWRLRGAVRFRTFFV
jgi:glycosyltransferase involved in cell wall biosynthesis